MTIGEFGDPTPRLEVAKCAYDNAASAAFDALPRETGGILVGWLDESTVVVVDALVIDDLEAGRYHYVRRHGDADTALAAYLEQTSDLNIGYVGEWHSHPEFTPPSETDHRSLRDVARELPHAAGLLVIAFNRDQLASPFGAVGLLRDGEVNVARVTPTIRDAVFHSAR